MLCTHVPFCVNKSELTESSSLKPIVASCHSDESFQITTYSFRDMTTVRSFKILQKLLPNQRIERLTNQASKQLTNQPTNQPTNYMERRLFSFSQESSRILCNSKVHYRIHNSPPPVPILSQIDQVHATILLLEDPF